MANAMGNGQECDLDITVIAPEAPGLPPLAWLREIGGLQAVGGVRLTIVGGREATAGPVATALRQRTDIVIWSGHGSQNQLFLSDGSWVEGEWVATQVRCGAPRVMVLAACGSQIKDEHLESLAGEVSRVGVNVVGMPLEAEDLGAISFNVEFVQALVAGADVGIAQRVALKRIADKYPTLAAGVFLTPGLTNGYRVIVDRIDAQDKRFDGIEQTLQTIVDYLGMGKQTGKRRAQRTGTG